MKRIIILTILAAIGLYGGAAALDLVRGKPLQVH